MGIFDQLFGKKKQDKPTMVIPDGMESVLLKGIGMH